MMEHYWLDDYLIEAKIDVAGFKDKIDTIVDTIDPEDPIAQTEGVEAFRLRFFPSNSFALWTWIMKDVSDTLSYGGRGELSTSLGEWGLTYHQDPSKSLQMIGQSNIPVSGPHNR